MAGKPTIPPEIHQYIRKLYRGGMSIKQIVVEMEVSNYTVRKAIDPDFAEREAARHRDNWPERKAQRDADPDFKVRRKERYFDTDEYRAAVRERMAALRAARKAGHTKQG